MQSLSVPQLLETLPKDEVIYYRSNPGNAGDALIASGAFLLFEKAGLNIQLINPDNFDSENKIVIYAGGGNLVGIYPEARDFIKKHHSKARQFILLPHTVANNDELLGELGPNVILYARELVTHKYLLEKAKNAKVYLDNDLAFYLDANKIIARPKISLLACLLLKVFYKLSKNKEKFSALPQPKIMLRNSVFEMKNKPGKDLTGNFFRDDVEKALETVPEGNADLSKMYEYGTRNKEICLYTTSRLMCYINQFNTINTDRLHICIAAALLGKTVNFYANSYFKCRAVYEFSLKDKYKNVNWCSPQ